MTPLSLDVALLSFRKIAGAARRPGDVVNPLDPAAGACSFGPKLFFFSRLGSSRYPALFAELSAAFEKSGLENELPPLSPSEDGVLRTFFSARTLAATVRSELALRRLTPPVASLPVVFFYGTSQWLASSAVTRTAPPIDPPLEPSLFPDRFRKYEELILDSQGLLLSSSLALHVFFRILPKVTVERGPPVLVRVFSKMLRRSRVQYIWPRLYYKDTDSIPRN